MGQTAFRETTLVALLGLGLDVMISSPEIAGIESELSAGPQIPGSNWGPKLGLFAGLSGVSLL